MKKIKTAKILPVILILVLIFASMPSIKISAANDGINEVYGVNTIEALLDAIATADGDTDIYLSDAIVISGSYDFANPGGYLITIYPYVNPRGLGYRHFVVKNVDFPTLTFDNVILDGDGQKGGGIYLAEGVGTLTLENAVIQNCYAANAWQNGDPPSNQPINDTRGGAVGFTWPSGEPLIYDRNLIITGPNTKLVNNKANDRGGAIQANHVTFEAGIISGNITRDYGGAINAFGGFTMTGGTISGNAAEGGNFVRGGGVCNYHGDIIVTGGTISNNRAIGTVLGMGGGIFSMDFKPSVAAGFEVIIGGGAKITDNYASGNGGGVNAARLTVNGGEIKRNLADSDGGGVYAENSMKMKSGVVSLNEASQDGGGIYCGNDFHMSGGQISDNEAGRNGGGICVSSWNPDINVKDVSTFVYTSENFITGGNISGNTAHGNGGGIYTNFIHNEWTAYYGADAYFNANLNFSGASVIGNKAVYGGGIFLNGKLDASSGAVSDNEAVQNGGGIWADYDNLTDVFVDKDVIFGGNTAIAAYYMNAPADIALHEEKILTPVRSSPPSGKPNFTYAYNNYDINYTAAGAENPAITYTVTYDANGGNGSVPEDNGKYSSGSQVAVSDKGGLSRTGFIFKGWSLTSGGSVKYEPGEVFNMSDYEGNIVLYAVWEKIHTVTLNTTETGSTEQHTAPATTTTETAAETETTTETETTADEPVTESSDELITEEVAEEITEKITEEAPTVESITESAAEKPSVEEVPATGPEDMTGFAPIVPEEIPTVQYPAVPVTETSDADTIFLTDNATPLSNGWFAVDSGDGWWEIFDENGVPLGVFFLSDGETIEELEIDFIEANLIPLNHVTKVEKAAEILEQTAKIPENNPKTGDNIIFVLIGFTLTCGIIMQYGKDKIHQ